MLETSGGSPYSSSNNTIRWAFVDGIKMFFWSIFSVFFLYPFLLVRYTNRFVGGEIKRLVKASSTGYLALIMLTVLVYYDFDHKFLVFVPTLITLAVSLSYSKLITNRWGRHAVHLNAFESTKKYENYLIVQQYQTGTTHDSTTVQQAYRTFYDCNSDRYSLYYPTKDRTGDPLFVTAKEYDKNPVDVRYRCAKPVSIHNLPDCIRNRLTLEKI